MTTTSKQLEKILIEVSKLNDPRKEFFQAWLKAHFGFSDNERIKSYFESLGADEAISEIHTISQEHLWCRDVSIRKIHRLA